MYYFLYFSLIGTLWAVTTWLLLLSQERIFQTYDGREVLFCQLIIKDLMTDFCFGSLFGFLFVAWFFFNFFLLVCFLRGVWWFDV